MEYFFIGILFFLFICQIYASVITIKLNHKKSIEFIGPIINSRLNEELMNKLICINNECIIILFDFNCATCRLLMKDLVKNNINDKRINLVTYGTLEEEIQYKKELNLDLSITLITEDLLKKSLNVKLFPFILHIKDNKVVNKGIASYDLMCSYLNIEG